MVLCVDVGGTYSAFQSNQNKYTLTMHPSRFKAHQTRTKKPDRFARCEILTINTCKTLPCSVLRQQGLSDTEQSASTLAADSTRHRCRHNETVPGWRLELFLSLPTHPPHHIKLITGGENEPGAGLLIWPSACFHRGWVGWG